MERGAPWSPRSFWHIFQKQLLVEILWKNPNIILDGTRQISAQTDEYLVRK